MGRGNMRVFLFYLGEPLMNMCPHNKNDVIFMIDKDNKDHFHPSIETVTSPFF